MAKLERPLGRSGGEEIQIFLLGFHSQMNVLAKKSSVAQKRMIEQDAERKVRDRYRDT